MDEQLLKKSVQSIEMPEDMKERIIKNCKSGEAKPLIMPKKRFVYMPIAAAACVCLLVAAAAGVGVWRMSVLSGEGGEGGDVSVLPETPEDYQLAGMSNVVLPEIKDGTDLIVTHYDSDGSVGEWRLNGESTNIVKEWLEGLRCSPVETESVVSSECYVFQVFDVHGAPTEVIHYYTSGYLIIRSNCYIVENPSDPPASVFTIEPPDIAEQLTLDKLLEICSGDCSTLSWSDFQRFECQDVGSGLYILYYDIEGKYSLTIGGVPDEDPWYMRFAVAGEQGFIDIREESIEDYLKEHTLNSSAKLIWPTEGGFISEWGYWDGGYSGHKGIDISGIETGAPVYAGADGVVTCAEWSGGLGWYVEIEHPDLGITSGYAHNNDIYVSVGQQVSQGELIAGAGASGIAAGTHIHLAVKVDGENVNPKNYFGQPSYGDDIINVIPITQADITYAYHDSDVTFIEGDQVEMTDEQLSEYYGIDITAFGNIPSDMTLREYESTTHVKSRHIWKRDGGTGEVYYDLNAFCYNNADNSRSIMITVGSIGAGPVGTLFEAPNKYSVIGGRNVVIGYTEDRQYYARFVSEDCVLGVQIAAGEGVTLEELHSIISALVEQTEVRDYGQSARNGEKLTLEKLKEICSNSAKLGWSDFEQFEYIQSGTGSVIRRYDIDGGYVLDIIGSLDVDPPEHIYFSSRYAGQSERIDIRTHDIDQYLPYYEDKANQVQEKGEKESAFAALELRENIARNAYDKYYDTYGDIPSGEDHTPEQQAVDTAVAEAAQAAIAYAAIGKGIDLPKAPVPDTVNVIPVSTVAAAPFWERSIYMTASGFSLHSVMQDGHYDKRYSLLDDYYGITVQPEVPSYMERQNDSYCFFFEGSKENVYLDVNVIRFVSNEHFKVYRDGAYGNLVLTVEVMKGGIPDYSPEFWNSPELLSDINGVTVAIGQVDKYHYAAEFMVGDVGFHITTDFQLYMLVDVISSLTAQYADHVKETYENYQDPGEGEFISGVQRVVKESATVEEMYQALEKFDTEGRIDKILISFDGRPVTEGRLVQGLNFEVYYDNEASWFVFQY